MKKLAIVGAGVAGLTAGIYALQSGFDVTIYEHHTIPGGASTSWRRGGYIFEGGMHWLTGSSLKMPLHRLWQEVGALDDSVEIHLRDPFFSYKFQGQTMHLYRDVNRLQAHLLALAPEDAREIRRFCGDIRKFTKIVMPVTDLKGVKVKNKSSFSFGMLLGMLPALCRMPFYGRLSAGEYAARFKNPLLRLMLENIIGPENSATGMIATLSTLCSGDGGYSEGGSLAMARRMAERFAALGGTLNYGAAVSQVCVRDSAACGLVVNGEEIAADAVLVTQDTLVAVDALFSPPIDEPWVQKMRTNTVPMLNTFICLGVEADLSELPESLFFPADKPLTLGNISENMVNLNHYARFKGYAPEGCTALTCSIMGDSYDFWKACKENGSYAAEKQRLAEAYIAILAKKFPQTAGKVAVWDVATPLTYERYLRSYKGSWMSMMRKGDKMQSYPCKPASLKNVYFAGQRLMPPGGLPVALETGRRAVQQLCLDTDTVFQGNS